VISLRINLKIIIYALAAIALMVGIVAYSNMEEEHEHDEHSLLAGDTDKLVLIGAVLAGVCLVSAVYLWKKAPSEDSDDNV
jgi:NADH:ubiquinone oxidoreductase subunit 6 (subunit J)